MKFEYNIKEFILTTMFASRFVTDENPSFFSYRMKCAEWRSYWPVLSITVTVVLIVFGISPYQILFVPIKTLCQ